MSERPIDPGIRAGAEAADEEGPGVPAEVFRDALSRWASGVTIVAVRDPDDGRVYATTVSSFASVSARPPRIVVSLGPGAQPLPFLAEVDGPEGAPGSDFVVSVLAAGQRGLAARFTDSFPVGPSPFPAEGPPQVEGAHAVLRCSAERLVPVGSSRLVVGLVVEAKVDDRAGPLLHYRREYHGLRTAGGGGEAG